MNAQNQYTVESDVIFSPFDARDYHIQEPCAAEYPEKFSLNMCSAKNQYNVSSCTATAMAGIIEYYNKEQEKVYAPMSIGYLYGNRGFTDYKGQGFNVRAMLKTAQKYGDTYEKDFPWNVEVPKAIELYGNRDKSIDKLAEKNRISSYYRVTTESEIKYALTQGCPILFAMKWYKNKVEDGILVFDKTKEQGAHAMIIYGWNKTGWLVQNSWGTMWGADGRVTIPYEESITELWVVTDNITDGKIEYKKPSWIKRLYQRSCNMIFSIIELFIKNNQVD